MIKERGAAGPEQHHLAIVVAVGIVILVLVAFILDNSEQVRVSFVVYNARFSLIWVLLVTNLLGFVAGYLVHGRLHASRAGRTKD